MGQFLYGSLEMENEKHMTRKGTLTPNTAWIKNFSTVNDINNDLSLNPNV